MYNGQPHFTVKASALKIYRSDNSGKVFMAPGPLAMNQDMPEKELSLDDFADIDEILKQAKNDPESEIHIPSVYSDYFNQLMNPTMLQVSNEEVVDQSGGPASSASEPMSDRSSQLDTTSLTKELKTLPATTTSN